ncbi:hypothetical protein [Bacillus sp. Marseille-P3800]|uniref:hypothetical protein n=1 Tax=Bacillus sp. Marseille-P3800 TaxID=2014782 RepID=UPI000C08D8C0|nr:hypothetical protein [Bacillus sp. Marseille-P3800]
MSEVDYVKRNLMRVVGWIAFVHIFFILMWLIINIITSILYPASFDADRPMMEVGLDYHASLVGYLAFDHGSKSLVMLMTMIVPIGLYHLFHKRSFVELAGLIAGLSGFLLYALSFMLQAVSVSYAIHLYNDEATNEFGRQFAMYVFDWTMLQGGFSTSLYIMANLLIAVWVILSSTLFSKKSKALRRIGHIVGILLIVSYLLSWGFLMLGHQNIHLFTETVGMLFLVWLGMLGYKLIKYGEV